MKTFVQTVACLYLATMMSFAQTEEKKEKTISKIPENLEITLTQPAETVKLADLNSGKFKLQMTIKNTGKTKLVIWPYITAKLTDSQGHDVPMTNYIGRFGVRRGDRTILEIFQFVTIEPGKTFSLPIPLNTLPDALFWAGWELKTAGEYQLHVRYQFDRAEIKNTYGEGAKFIDRETAKWNQALEVDTTLVETIKVKQ